MYSDMKNIISTPMIIQNTEYAIIEDEHITIHSFSANKIGKLILCHVNYTCDESMVDGLKNKI